MLTIEYAVSINEKGTTSFVAPHYIGSGEVLQARALIHGAIAKGNLYAMKFCRQVFQRVQQDSENISELRLVRGTHNSVAYLQGDKSHSVEKTIVACQN